MSTPSPWRSLLSRPASRRPSPSRRGRAAGKFLVELLEDRSLLSVTVQPLSLASPTLIGDAMGGLTGRSAVSADGRFVVFESDSNLLIPGDTNGTTDVFVRDLQTGSVVRASTTGAGAQ